MNNGLHTLLIVKNWSLTAAAVVIAVIVAGAFTAGRAFAQAVSSDWPPMLDDSRSPYHSLAQVNKTSNPNSELFLLFLFLILPEIIFRPG